MDTAPQDTDPRIVVGVDGSASAARALHWAALEAVRTSALLRIISVWSVPNTSWGVPISAYIDPGDLEEAARKVVQRALRSVRRELGTGAPRSELLTVQGDAAERLLEVSEGADLLVVGTRGRGGFASLVLGSVATACAHHTTVPLVVVGVDAPDPGTGDVVVGMDDSIGARTALRWALDDAAHSNATVRVVHGWDPPVPVGGGNPTLGVEHPILPSGEAGRLDQAIAEQTRDRAGSPPVAIVALPMAAAEAVVQEAKSAALLVLGSRGRGGFLGLRLGSVGQQCLHHSSCPVVIVPTTVPVTVPVP